MVSIDSLILFFEANKHITYIILFLGSYFETLIGPGFLIYGEIFFLSGAILAGLGQLNIWIVAICCISGGILGDTSSYFIGKKYGKIIVNKLFKKSNKYLTPKQYNKSISFMKGHGTKAIFLARFMGPLSWITPFIAGTMKIPYRKFAFYNMPAVAGGIGLFIIAGYTLGFSYQVFLSKIDKFLLYALGMIIVLGIIIILEKKLIKRKASI